jgi:hypothetical protein
MDKDRARSHVTVCHIDDPSQLDTTMIFAVQLMKQVITPHMVETVGGT